MHDKQIATDLSLQKWQHRACRGDMQQDESAGKRVIAWGGRSFRR